MGFASYAEDFDKERSLIELLKSATSQVSSGSRLVLTRSPSLWTKTDEVDGISRVVDLTSLMGRHTDLGFSESVLEDQVFEHFDQAGWPIVSLRQEYRQDAKYRLRADLAIVDKEDRLLMVVEVKHKLSDAMRDQVQQYASAFDAELFCITDGVRYHVFRQDGSTLDEFDRAPTPGDLQLDQRLPDQRKSASADRNVVRPDSVAELQKEAQSIDPSSVILDHTIPLRQRSSFRELRELLPGNGYSKRLEAYDILLMWASSIPSVRTVTSIVPYGLAFSSTKRNVREFITSELNLNSLIELPTGVFSPRTSIKGAFVLFGGSSTQTYFDRLPVHEDLSGPSNKEWFRSLMQWLQGETSRRGFTASPSIDDWSVQVNDPALQEIEQQLESIAHTEPLSELSSAFHGLPHSRVHKAESGAQDSIPFLKGKDFREFGLHVEEADHVTLADNEVDNQYWLQPGDVLLSRIYHENMRAIVNEEVQEALVSENVIIIRPDPDKISPTLVCEFLNSYPGQKLLSAHATGMMKHISLSQIRQLPVPVLDHEQSASIHQVKHLERQLMTRATDLQAKRENLFNATSTEQFHDKLTSLRQEADVLSTSVRQATEFQFMLRNFYPFPLAYGYRVLQGIVNPTQKYIEQLQYGENILAFLASVSMSALQEEDKEAVAAAFSARSKNGMSPGDWRELTRLSCEQLQRYVEHPLASSISGLQISKEQKDFGRNMSNLIQLLNDLKHKRGPNNEDQYIEHAKMAENHIQQCLQALSFFSSYPIHQVLSIDVDKDTEQTQLTCWNLSGDHPGFQQEVLNYPKPLPLKLLYMQKDRQDWIKLHPFITAHNCPQCGTQEIFFVDKWSSREKAQLKSFERGHTIESDEIGRELQKWCNSNDQ